MARLATGCLICLLLAPCGAGAQTLGVSPSSGDQLSGASELQLDSLYGPLLYLMRPDERGIYPELSLKGKRDFLRRFWAQRDPTPGTPKNEAEDTFDLRIAEVNRKFRVTGTDTIPGWRTDRGRVYLEYGPPDIVLTRRLPGPNPPYEVWKYMRGKLRKYCFVDVTRFGAYVLVYSSDPAEPTRSDWRELVGDNAYIEVMRF